MVAFGTELAPSPGTPHLATLPSSLQAAQAAAAAATVGGPSPGGLIARQQSQLQRAENELRQALRKLAAAALAEEGEGEGEEEDAS